MNEKYIFSVDKLYWRVGVNVRGIKTVKCFNYEKNGGKQEALKKAVKWRNDILRRNGLLDRLKYKKSPTYYRLNSVNPCIGVRITTNVTCGKKRIHWTARYSIDEVAHKRSFSIAEYGYERAFHLACEVRYKYCGPIRMLSTFKYKPTVPFIKSYPS